MITSEVLKIVKVWTSDFDTFEKLSDDYRPIWVTKDDVKTYRKLLDKEHVAMLKSGVVDEIIVMYDE